MNSELFETAVEKLSPIGLRRETLSEKTASFLTTYKIPKKVN
ncbi:hypothetical protein [Paenibacillus sp. N3.4]|nr:hypothetical protein [Paenibacillus sp. N3.4]